MTNATEARKGTERRTDVPDTDALRQRAAYHLDRASGVLQLQFEDPRAQADVDQVAGEHLREARQFLVGIAEVDG